jgi:putative ABC transport system permease protein
VLALQTADVRALETFRPDTIVAVAGIDRRSSEGARLAQIPGRAEYVLAERVTSGYAEVFGLYAQAGRWISVEDDRDAMANVAVISDRLWRDWFGADPTIVGRASLTLSRPYTIVGVAPPGFRGIQTGLAPTEVWLALAPPHPALTLVNSAGWAQYQARYPLQAFIKVRPGVSTAQAEGDIRAVMTDRADPDPAASTAALRPASIALRVDELVDIGLGILAFSSLVFLAACANLTNMLYARGTERAGEIAVRLSLGASAGNILCLLIAEAAIVALAAATLGLALAGAGTSAFRAAFPTFRLAQGLGVTIDVASDYRAFFYAFGAGAIAGLAVGLVTAWRASRVPVTQALASSSTANVVSSRRRGLPTTFASVQITAAILLLIGAGLFIENTHSALDRRVHYDTSQLAAARVIRTPPEAPLPAWDVLKAMTVVERDRFFAERRRIYYAQREGFFAELVARMRGMPGVEAAAVADAFPGGTAPAPSWGKSILQAADAPALATGLPRKLDGSWINASPEFLDTIGVPLVRGRGILPTDLNGAPTVAVLSASAADGLWPGEDPIGKQLHCCRFLREPITVVGVVQDPASSSDASPWTRYSNFVFLPAAETGGDERFIVVRAKNAAGQIDVIRAAVRGLDEHAPVFDAGVVDEFLLAGVAVQRAERALTTSLGLLSLGIAMLGVYAVVSYFVSRRTREFGLRLALGAMPRQILKLVVDYAIHIILIGLLPGVLLASLGTRLFEHQLFGIMPNGITMWVVAPLLMLTAGVLAGLVPARRAARVDPNVALREL